MTFLRRALRFAAYASMVLLAGHLPARAAGVDLAAPGAALPIDAPIAALKACPATCEIEIEGIVKSSEPLVAVMRIDDVQSKGYGSRVNEEKALPPGPFKWRKPLFGIRTVNGRIIYGREITRLILFVAKGAGTIEIKSFRLVEVPPLPVGAVGLSFGHVEAPLLSGFERVGASDPRLTGQVFNIRHSSPDPLIATGMRGIQEVKVPWPKGRALVSLWTEDPGEWENLPHPLERRIVVNDTEVFRQKMTPPQWVKQRYLSGSDGEAGPQADAWTEFGRHRGGLVSAEVDVGGEGVVVSLDGDSPAGMFLSAMLVEPGGQHAALDQVQALRARWYRETWSIGSPMLHGAAHEVAVTLGQAAIAPLKVSLAPGTGGRAIVAVASSELVAAPDLAIRPPRSEAGELGVKIWAAQRQLDRVGVSSNLIAVRDERLRHATRRFPIEPGTPRRYEIWVSAPADAKPGLYEGAIRIGDAKRQAELPLSIEVLPVRLPEAAKPVGFFHDEAPHLTWFSWPGDLRRRQIGCDIAVLAGFGLKGNAPAVSTPYVNRSDDLMRDVQAALQNGNETPLMAYAPAKRALADQGPDGAIQSIADAEHRIRDKGWEPLLWSVADEPSNPDLAGGDLRGWIGQLRAALPGIRLTAHLNNKADKALMPLFDVAIVNGGYGLDLADLDAILAKGVEPWIYNADALRFTAGLWLWASPARHFIQWHARAPTADPFDPTDGREGDVQVFYPSMDICAPQPDMSVRALEMAEGVVDQRWLQWLDARPEADAKALSASIKAELGRQFSVSAQFDDARMAAIRQRIIALSRHLN